MAVIRIQRTHSIADKNSGPFFGKRQARKKPIQPMEKQTLERNPRQKILRENVNIGEKALSLVNQMPDGSSWFLKRKLDGRIVKVTVQKGITTELTYLGKIPQ